MFGLNALKTALAALTGNVTALAATVGELNAGLRERTGLDVYDGPPALDGPVAESADPAALPARKNGRVKAGV